MKKSISIAWFALFFITLSCSPKLKITKYIHNSTLSQKNEKKNFNCRNPLNYLPDTIHKGIDVMKYGRIAWHFTDDKNWQNNFPAEKVKEYFSNLTNNANERLEHNFKMQLPRGNSTIVYDPLFRWKITPTIGFEKEQGFYFHKEDSIVFFNNKGRFRTDYSNREIEKYGISKDTISNIFVIPISPDSLRKKSFRFIDAGIALGNHVKMGGLFQANKPDWMFATLLNHELGHVYGLSHSWHDDGCDDTPTHPNCWSKTDTPPCDQNVSNNVMDYNSEQMAWTPCQIGKIHAKINDTTSTQRKLVIPTWCNLDTTGTIHISDSISWQGYRDVNKTIVIESGGILRACCRLGMPKGGKILIKVGGKLILEEIVVHNDCNQKWGGIWIEEKGKKKGTIEIKGKVEIVDVE